MRRFLGFAVLVTAVLLMATIGAGGGGGTQTASQTSSAQPAPSAPPAQIMEWIVDHEKPAQGTYYVPPALWPAVEKFFGQQGKNLDLISPLQGKYSGKAFSRLKNLSGSQALSHIASQLTPSLPNFFGDAVAILVRVLEVLVGVALLFLGLQALTGTGGQGQPLRTVRKYA